MTAHREDVSGFWSEVRSTVGRAFTSLGTPPMSSLAQHIVSFFGLTGLSTQYPSRSDDTARAAAAQAALVAASGTASASRITAN